MTDESRKQAEEIGEKFEKEFSTRSDYFNHRIGLFMEMKEWIVREAESYVSLKVAEATKEMYPKEFVEWYCVKPHGFAVVQFSNPPLFTKFEEGSKRKYTLDELSEYWKQNIRK